MAATTARKRRDACAPTSNSKLCSTISLVNRSNKRRQTPDQVSGLTTNRLSVYLRCLNELDAGGVQTISSQSLAEQFHLNAAQIRKDLAYFGEFGVCGRFLASIGIFAWRLWAPATSGLRSPTILASARKGSRLRRFSTPRTRRSDTSREAAFPSTISAS